LLSICHLAPFAASSGPKVAPLRPAHGTCHRFACGLAVFTTRRSVFRRHITAPVSVPTSVELRKVSDETPQKKVAENRKKHRPTAGDRSLGRRELCLQPIGTLSQNTPFFFCFFCFLTGPYYIDCGLSVRRNYGMARIDPASSRGLT
jgi:hypothetical protein